ncbi:hypothetical protein [Rhizobium tubonense]|uniref:hypothetical protein n=1 Tax=Rhizobium tubonense TaxID=484088 RepID=UPI0026793501
MVNGEPRVARERDKILDGGGPRQAAVARAVTGLRLTTGQIYNLLARYPTERTMTALLPRITVSRRKRLPTKVEGIICATLREQWLTLEALSLAPIVAEIRARRATGSESWRCYTIPATSVMSISATPRRDCSNLSSDATAG